MNYTLHTKQLYLKYATIQGIDRGNKLSNPSKKNV